VSDSRDNRLETYNKGTRGWGCTAVFLIRFVQWAPLDQINKIKQKLANEEVDSRPIRHHKVLVDWLNTGLQTLGDFFRDLKELLSIAPLGLRMLVKGKFPLV